MDHLVRRGRPLVPSELRRIVGAVVRYHDYIATAGVVLIGERGQTAAD